MQLTWNQILSSLDSCYAKVRWKNPSQPDVVLEGEILVTGEDLHFVASSETAENVPDRGFAQLLVFTARGVVSGSGLLIRKNPQRFQVFVSGPVTVTQRRTHFRFSVQHPVSLELGAAGAAAVGATLSDLSLGGARIISPTELRPGHVVRVEIPSTPVGSLKLNGRVQRVAALDDKTWSVGVEWKDISTEDREKLKQLLLAVLSKRWPREGDAGAGSTGDAARRRAERAQELITQVARIVMNSNMKAEDIHEAIRLSTELIDEVNKLIETLRSKGAD